MKVSRKYTNHKSKPCLRTDEMVVGDFLTGYLDYYSGGELEHMRQELTNLRDGVATLLLAINKDAVLKACLNEGEE